MPRRRPTAALTVSLSILIDPVKSLKQHEARHWIFSLRQLVDKLGGDIKSLAADTASTLGVSHAFCEWDALS